MRASFDMRKSATHQKTVDERNEKRHKEENGFSDEHAEWSDEGVLHHLSERGLEDFLLCHDIFASRFLAKLRCTSLQDDWGECFRNREDEKEYGASKHHVDP